MGTRFKKVWLVWGPVLATMIVPGSGYVWLGIPARGLQSLFFMGLLGWVSYHFTGVDISPLGRLSGGFAVWVLSVVDIHRLARLRFGPKQGLPN